MNNTYTRTYVVPIFLAVLFSLVCTRDIFHSREYVHFLQFAKPFRFFVGGGKRVNAKKKSEKCKNFLPGTESSFSSEEMP